MTNVLIVCTANRCRSPIGEGLMKRALPGADVSSAGFLPSGSPAEADAIAVMAEVGIDISNHRSRTVSSYLIDEADLILVMERAHEREITETLDGHSKTFTIKDFVRHSEAAPRNKDEDLSAWIARLNKVRDTPDLQNADSDQDVIDPIGQIDSFRTTRDGLGGLIEKAATGLR